MQRFKDENDFKAKSGYDIDGTWYPRVTRITDMKAKPALYRFYGTVGYDQAKRISEKSAEEGTLVHEIAEKILIGDVPSSVDKSIEPAINALWKFLQKNKIEVQPEHVEMRAVNETHRYAGTLDVLANIGGKFGILDIKTSQAIYPDFGIQVSAYFDALKDKFPNLETRWILRIDQQHKCKRCAAKLRRKGGRDKVIRAWAPRNSFNSHYDVVQQCPEDQHEWGEAEGEIELKELKQDWKADFNAFLGAKALWEWEHADWLKRIGYKSKQQELL